MENEIKDLKEQMQSISLVAHEAMEARSERREKRYIAVIILLILLLVGTNGAWLWYKSSMETVKETTTTTVTQDSETGFNNYIGNNGDITNGETNGN